MTAFGKKIKFLATIADRLSDQSLAVVITLRGVDDVETGIERAIQQFGDSLGRRVLIADLRSSKSEDRDVHIGLSKATFFHFVPEPRITRM